MLLTLAQDDEDLRTMIAQGQSVLAPEMLADAVPHTAPEFQI